MQKLDCIDATECESGNSATELDATTALGAGSSRPAVIPFRQTGNHRPRHPPGFVRTNQVFSRGPPPRVPGSCPVCGRKTSSTKARHRKGRGTSRPGTQARRRTVHPNPASGRCAENETWMRLKLVRPPRGISTGHCSENSRCCVHARPLGGLRLFARKCRDS